MKKVIKKVIFLGIFLLAFVLLTDKVYAMSGLIEADDDFVCSDIEFLTRAWLFIRILAPFLIILFGSLDFFKSVVAGDEKQMKQARGKFFKRLIAFLLLIILPFVIQLTFSLMGTYGSQNVCLIKCIATNDTSDTPCPSGSTSNNTADKNQDTAEKTPDAPKTGSKEKVYDKKTIIEPIKKGQCPDEYLYKLGHCVLEEYYNDKVNEARKR